MFMFQRFPNVVFKDILLYGGCEVWYNVVSVSHIDLAPYKLSMKCIIEYLADNLRDQGTPDINDDKSKVPLSTVSIDNILNHPRADFMKSASIGGYGGLYKCLSIPLNYDFRFFSGCTKFTRYINPATHSHYLSKLNKGWLNFIEVCVESCPSDIRYLIYMQVLGQYIHIGVVGKFLKRALYEVDYPKKSINEDIYDEQKKVKRPELEAKTKCPVGGSAESRLFARKHLINWKIIDPFVLKIGLILEVIPANLYESICIVYPGLMDFINIVELRKFIRYKKAMLQLGRSDIIFGFGDD